MNNLIKGLSIGKIINNINKTLNLVNKALPIYQQIKPIISNSKDIISTLNKPNNKEKKVDNNLPTFFQ